MNLKHQLVFLALYLAVLNTFCKNPVPEDFEIKNLPGLKQKLNFKQYSGYIEATKGTQIFFWFVESQSNPRNDPVSYWTNGGPGGSGIAAGFFQEHGPFRVNEDMKTLELYEQSWNKISNVLYVEQPAGVGFSWSEDETHYEMDDQKAANDIYYFLQNFFEIFKDFQQNDLLLTSESYGGHYIPTLAKRIIDGIDSQKGLQLFKQTKGLLIGNPYIYEDGYGAENEYPFLSQMYFHSLLPTHAWEDAVEKCGWANYTLDCQRDFSVTTKDCDLAVNKCMSYVPKTFDPYDLLAPTCHKQSNQEFVQTQTPWMKSMQEKYNMQTSYDPCMSDYIAPYVQQEEVVKAIHAEKHPNQQWPQTRKGWSYNDISQDMTKLFPVFFEHAPHWKIEIVSGASDTVCAFTGTLKWINCLDKKIINDWTNWYVDGDVAGSTIDFEGITYTSVKGCGHLIPTYCPKKGLEFFRNYINKVKMTNQKEFTQIIG